MQGLSTISSERSLYHPNNTDLQALQREVKALSHTVRAEMEALGDTIRTEIGGLKTEIVGIKAGMREIAHQVGSLNMEVVSLTTQVKEGFAGLTHQNALILETLRQLVDSNRQLVAHLTQQPQIQTFGG